jgi:hypothetical protein
MIEDAMYTIAKAHGGLTGLIGAGDNCRIYPSGAQVRVLPDVEWVKEPFRPISGIWLDTGWGYTVFDFLVRAATAREAGLVVEQLRSCFARYHSNGAVVGATAHKVDDIESDEADQAADYDHELGCYTQGIAFEFFHN